MQWSRVKSILIILLLLVDGFLACMLGVKAFSAYQRKQENREHLNIVLADCGMKLADGVSLPDDALMPQLNIFFLSLPLQIYLGLGLLFMTVPIIIVWFTRYYENGLMKFVR